MPTERLEFPGHSGEMLAARLDRPGGRIKAVALFAHCFTCSKDIPAARRIAGRLAALDIAVLRFDFTGLGHSAGEFANTHFSSNVEDLVAAARHLETQGLAPDLLIGHSLGGAAVLAAAGEIASAKAVVTIGAPHEPEHVIHNFGCKLDEIRAEGVATVSLAGRDFTIRRDFLEDVSAQRLDTRIAALKRALLVLHAPRDQTVGIENAGAIFAAARHPKSFVSLDHADHLLSDGADADYAAEVIAAWVRRYLDLGEEPGPELPEGVTRVSESGPAGFTQDIHTGRHMLTADEPKSVGGADLGPTPYQLLSAALGACTAMTMRMYAGRKKWPLEKVWVDVTHDKEHFTDCAGCEDKPQKIDVFHRILHVEGPLDAEQRARLVEIADKCPVHRTLEASARVETTLDDTP